MAIYRSRFLWSTQPREGSSRQTTTHLLRSETSSSCFSYCSFLLLLISSPFPECNQSRKTGSISSPYSAPSVHRWKWALHSLDLLELLEGCYIAHTFNRWLLKCMAVVRGTTFEMYLVFHSHLPILAPCSNFPLSYCSALPFLTIIQNHCIHILSISPTVSAAHMGFSDT